MHTYFYSFLLALVFLQPGAVLSQEKSSFDYALSPGIAYQGQPFYELNLLVGRYESGLSGNAFLGARIGMETNFANGDACVFAPKVGIEFSGMLICFRGTVLTYINGPHTQLRLLPEIGISLFCFANLTYGYAFPVSKSDHFDVSGHRIALSFNLNRDILYTVF